MSRAGDGWIVVIGLLLLAMSGRRTAELEHGSDEPNVWTWPLPRLADGRKPRRSAKFGTWRLSPTPHTHVGIDVMYERRHALPKGTKLPTPDHGSIGFELPDGTQVVAARAGKVWSVSKTGRGIGVVVDHGSPWSTFYQHLSAVYVAKGDRVEAGQPLGEAGYDPSGTDQIRHLHFEIRDGNTPIDPEPLLIGAAMIEG
jgi:murein DD-endopeptidase MepM/ murein hydrolase activator NlpD